MASASPLKRSDALMNLDQPGLSSPVAKRRSLHGIASFGNDFNIFDHSPAPTSQPSFEIHDDAMNHEYQLTGSGPSLFRDQAPPPTPTVTRRASSLRKTTLQQRHGEGRTSLGRRQGEKQVSTMASEAASPPAPRNRPRLSLDQYLPPEPRGSPFTAHHPLPHPSIHMFGGPQNHPRHPLSRTITQSSSGSSSSVPDESPTHFPVTFITDKPRVPLNFAKSVPIGSQRPSDGNAVSTPAYKSAKPDPNAFASTGLVSKVGRRAEAERLKLDTTASTPMPDTPCKKQHYPANTFPPQSSLSGRRPNRPSFAASPSTPFNTSWKNPPAFPISFGNSERLGGLFKPRNAHSRRASLLSLDGDDTQGADGDYIPPTPTKNLFVKATNDQPQSSTTPNGSPSATRFFPAPDPSATANGLDVRPSLQNVRSATPTTPQASDSMVPPDPSRLSISNSHASHSSATGASSSARPPATPTTQGRMSLSFIGRGERRFSITSAQDDVESEYDVLGRRFDKSEAIGSGEFSHVFKVTKSTYPPYAPVFATTPGRHTPSSPRPDVRVYVVKKLCAPITGPKDRKKRYREVEVLKALSQCDHVVRYFESWEENHQLYIQTEYCEEGSLEEFLDNVGKTGRLDDFRIWKIMLELCYVSAFLSLLVVRAI
jgi:mitosis inhibitor protein kinase SWE1